MKRRHLLTALAVAPLAALDWHGHKCSGKSPHCVPASPTPPAAPTATPTRTPMPVVSNYPHPPIAPQTYTVPGGATSVSNGATLQTALNGATAIDIVCQTGTYDAGAATYFTSFAKHRIYSNTLHGAVFTSGLNIRKGALVQGLKFTITDITKTLNGAAIYQWDDGAAIESSTYRDLDIDGGNAIDYGIRCVDLKTMEGLIIQRVKLRNFALGPTSFGGPVGLRLSNNTIGTVITNAMLIEDIDVANVVRTIPQQSDGTAEAGLWIGNKATIRRVKIRNCGWMGMNTISSCDGSLFEHFDIDDIRYGTTGLYSTSSPGGGIGIYLEHKTKNSIFRFMKIGTDAGKVLTGITMEWDLVAGAGGDPGAHYNTLEDITIWSRKNGIYMDEGTLGQTIRRIKFRDQCRSCVGDYLTGSPANTYTDNDYTEKDAGASTTDTTHTTSSACGVAETGYTS